MAHLPAAHRSPSMESAQAAHIGFAVCGSHIFGRPQFTYIAPFCRAPYHGMLTPRVPTAHCHGACKARKNNRAKASRRFKVRQGNPEMNIRTTAGKSVHYKGFVKLACTYISGLSCRAARRTIAERYCDECCEQFRTDPWVSIQSPVWAKGPTYRHMWHWRVPSCHYYLDLQNGQNNGPYAACTLYFGILGRYFGLFWRFRDGTAS